MRLLSYRHGNNDHQHPKQEELHTEDGRLVIDTQYINDVNITNANAFFSFSTLINAIFNSSFDL